MVLFRMDEAPRPRGGLAAYPSADAEPRLRSGAMAVASWRSCQTGRRTDRFSRPRGGCQLARRRLPTAALLLLHVWATHRTIATEDTTVAVLTTTERGAERMVGEARYVVSRDKETAEFGIAVAEGFRDLGLPERLMAALIGAARAAGLRWLIGEVLAGNARMLAFARRCGFAETTRGGLEPGLVRVERCVDRPLAVAEADGSPTGAVHRTVSRLLARFLPLPLESTWDFQQL